MQTRLTLFIVFLLATTSVFSQTFNGSGGAIADDNGYSDFVINVQGLAPAELTTTHGLSKVCINAQHSWISDLDIRLITPDGINLMLISNKGDDTDHFSNTCFTMDAPTHIIKAIPPFTGNYKPYSSLGNANNGQNGNGIWTLRIFDSYPFADSGELLEWSLEFGAEAASPFVFDSTSLPVIMIHTDNVTIKNDPKIDGTISVIDNEEDRYNKLTDAPVFSSAISIETRGSSSQQFPKKSFGFETQDEEGEDLEIALFGFPKEEDWILYAPYTDKSLLRDAITYQLGRDMGRYAPRTMFVELFLNGDYHGIYCLEEKIKRDKGRVNVTKLNETDTIGDALTGGYILKVDRDDGEGTYFVGEHGGSKPGEELRVVYEDPEGPDLHQSQKDYIRDYYYAFENALYGDDFKDPETGYRKYIDVPSFIDFFIVSELGHNVDAYRLSTFLYKDRDSKDSLLHLGPLWDFNLAYGNVDYCNSETVHGWAYDDSGECGNTPLWWNRLLEDPKFTEELRCRYNELREDILRTGRLTDYLDSMATLFVDADHRNYDRWPILGMYVWPNDFIGQTYDEEVGYLKIWIVERLQWMDKHLPGNCEISGIDTIDNADISMSPNPAEDFITIDISSASTADIFVTIADPLGRTHMRVAVQQNQQIDISALPAGTYFARLDFKGKFIGYRNLFVIR